MDGPKIRFEEIRSQRELVEGASLLPKLFSWLCVLVAAITLLQFVTSLIGAVT